MEKQAIIKLRIEKFRKEEWKQYCIKRNITVTSLIISSVEGRLLDDERRIVLKFIEKQDNLFVKIETNINQVAKVANVQKFINANELGKFSERVSEVVQLKKEQNKIFAKIYAMLAK